MSFLSEHNQIMDALKNAVADALKTDIKEGLLKSIKKSAYERVYSYEASREAMQSRRYEIFDRENLEITYPTDAISIKNITVMQSGEPGEAAVVEEGIEYYRQPYPRPFMEEAAVDYVSSGEGDYTLAKVLWSHGFDGHFE